MKIIKEENELEKRAKFNRKHNKGLGWFVSLGESVDDDKLDQATPYMLRNDGKLFNVSPIHPYIKYAYESIDKAIEKLATSRLNSLKWFYENTNSIDTKNLIKIICNYLHSTKDIDVDFCDYSEAKQIKPEEVAGYLNLLNDNTNQEFCRFRTSNLLFSGDSNEIYFRISSINFNWFDLIWAVCYKYKHYISDVTICKDANTFGGRFNPYKVNNKELNHIDIDEFLTLSGNPIIENYKSDLDIINNANILLSQGKLITESYLDPIHPDSIHGFYEKQISENLNRDIESLLG